MVTTSPTASPFSLVTTFKTNKYCKFNWEIHVYTWSHYWKDDLMDGWRDDSTADCFWESHPSESRTWQNPLLKSVLSEILTWPRTKNHLKQKSSTKYQEPLDQEPMTTWSRTRTVPTKNQRPLDQEQGPSQPRTTWRRTNRKRTKYQLTKNQ